MDWALDLDDFDANGFSGHARSAGGNDREICYLALNFNGAVESWVGTHTTPTSTGNDSEAGPSFTPQAVFLIGTMMEALDTAYNDALAGSLVALGAFDGDDEYCTSVCDEDNAATTNTQSLSDDTAVELPDDDGSAGLTASFVSFDANGWTLNYSAVKANAKYWFALAIEAEIKFIE